VNSIATTINRLISFFIVFLLNGLWGVFPIHTF